LSSNFQFSFSLPLFVRVFSSDFLFSFICLEGRDLSYSMASTLLFVLPRRRLTACGYEQRDGRWLYIVTWEDPVSEKEVPRVDVSCSHVVGTTTILLQQDSTLVILRNDVIPYAKFIVSMITSFTGTTRMPSYWVRKGT